MWRFRALDKTLATGLVLIIFGLIVGIAGGIVAFYPKNGAYSGAVSYPFRSIGVPLNIGGTAVTILGVVVIYWGLQKRIKEIEEAKENKKPKDEK